MTSTPPPETVTTTTTRDDIPEKLIKEWEATQIALAAKATFDDSLCGFDPSDILGIPNYFKDQKDSFPSLDSVVGKNSSNSKNNDDDDSGSGQQSIKRPPLRYVGGLDISFVKDTPIAVACLVVLDLQNAVKLDEDQQKSKTSTRNAAGNQNPYPVVYEDMLHCKMDVPYVPGYLAFREVEPLRQLIARIKERAPQFLPQLYCIDGNGLLHFRRCGCAVHFGALEDVPILGCAKKILAVDGMGRDTTEKLVVDATKDPTLVPGTFSYRNTSFVPLYGPNSGFLYGYGVLSGNSTSKPIYISPGNRISPRLAAMLAIRLAPFRVVEPIRQADLRSRRYISEKFADVLSNGGNDQQQD
jgi:endonuclease V